MKKIGLFFVMLITMVMNANAQGGRIKCKGLAIVDKGFKFEPYSFTRHALDDDEIEIEVLYAAICHSDLHEANADWYEAHYPFVPGHENVGRVKRMGKNVTRFKVGDYAGVGPSVNSCGECYHCLNGRDNYCQRMVSCYNSDDYYHDHEVTQGGTSNIITCNERFALRIPKDANIKRVAPLLCAGVTTYVPFFYFTPVKEGQKVAVAGFGGLGHLAVKYARSLGCKVTVFDITEDKRQAAYDMGAEKYVNVNDSVQLQGLDNTFDLLITTIPSKYDLTMYLNMVKFGGELCILGAPATKNMPTLHLTDLMWNGGKKVYCSMDGSVRQIQECLDYSIEHNIYPDVEVIEATAENMTKAYNNVLNGKVKFRYVVDMKMLK